MRIPTVALLVVLGLPPCGNPDPSSATTGLLSVANDSTVDVSFEFTAGGKRLPGCFWVLRGRSTTFELPRGHLTWSYSIGGAQFSGGADLSAGFPKMLRCATAQARLGGDVPKCEPASPASTPPPKDSQAMLVGATLGFLAELSQTLQRGEESAVAELIEPPFTVEWTGEVPGTRRVKSARHLLEVRSELALDPVALAAAKARGGDARSGEDDCGKNEVDWSKGEPALSCDGRTVSVALRPSAACGRFGHVDTWKLESSGDRWRLVGKGLKTRTP
ncbi:MAG: hypothetical protein IPM35_34990 [Myxococcales bacterium]|nr:hypothetical protein [Myxococcales bacterium]